MDYFVYISIAVSFLVALLTSLWFTPLLVRWGSRRGYCDTPSERKVHLEPIPRIGGISLFLSFSLAWLVSLSFLCFLPGFSENISKYLIIFIGATGFFALGLFDDIKGLPAWFKLVVQVLLALGLWFGNIDVERFSVSFYSGINLSEALSLLLTVFWIVLVVNAINLIDGLDGLAAGICFFASIILLLICFASAPVLVVVGFSALAGACCGFLRYNFNPASIFMGDSGSYLLGYLLAVFTIEGSMKSHAAVVLLLPIIALGVPLLDTLLAPVRRFVMGKKMFQADDNHLHHLLMRLGFSHRSVVLIIYGVTVFLGVVALLFVYFKDQRAALLLLLPGVVLFVLVRRLGYWEYVAADKVFGWLRDVLDEAGLSNGRRSFLNIQMQIVNSENHNELWNEIVLALKYLGFDYAELHLSCTFDETGELFFSSFLQDESEKGEFDFNSINQFKVELPLLGKDNNSYGILWMVKDLQRSNMSHYTLRRVENLRRTVIAVLNRMSGVSEKE